MATILDRAVTRQEEPTGQRCIYYSEDPLVIDWQNAADAAALGRKAQVNEADRFSASILPFVRAIQSSGASSLADIAAALNNRGIRSARGGRWHVSSVQNLLARAERQETSVIGGNKAARTAYAFENAALREGLLRSWNRR